jgi:hypothetical protein
MPAVILSIIYALSLRLVIRVLASIGLGYLTYVGLTDLVDYITVQSQILVSGLPPGIISIFGYMEFDKMMTILISAYTMRLVYTGVGRAFGIVS